jgi:hypothetical protein
MGAARILRHYPRGPGRPRSSTAWIARSNVTQAMTLEKVLWTPGFSDAVIGLTHRWAMWLTTARCRSGEPALRALLAPEQKEGTLAQGRKPASLPCSARRPSVLFSGTWR